MKPVRLLLADDHDIVIAGLRLVLDQPEFEIAGAVQDGRALRFGFGRRAGSCRRRRVGGLRLRGRRGRGVRYRGRERWFRFGRQRCRF